METLFTTMKVKKTDNVKLQKIKKALGDDTIAETLTKILKIVTIPKIQTKIQLVGDEKQ